MATSRAYPNQGKSSQDKVSGDHRDRTSLHKNANTIHTVTGLARHQVDQSKGSLDHIRMDSLKSR